MSLSDDARQEAHDAGYLAGSRAAWVRILQDAVHQLGYQVPTAEALLLEREAVVALLRQACADFGDNDWPEDLHLEDVLDKHLLNHLYRQPSTRKRRPRNA